MLATCFLLLVFSLCTIHCRDSSSSNPKDVTAAYLDIAMDMITKAKDSMPSDFDCQQCEEDCPECPQFREFPEKKAADCADVFNMGGNKSGIYEIWPMNRLMEDKFITVYCDMDTDGGGWTVIQRRGDFGSPEYYFYTDWKTYKEGFGKIAKDFWLGNDNIFFLTNQKIYSVRFDLMDVEKNRSYALYDNFWIDGEDRNYTLHISNYSGDAGDAMAIHNNQAFSTKDRDNDNNINVNCAADRKGGWWYNSCATANLNGMYYKGEHPGLWDGLYWQPWRGAFESLEWTEIKIRPKYFGA